MADLESINNPCEPSTPPVKKRISVEDLKLDLSELNGHSVVAQNGTTELSSRPKTLSGDYTVTNGEYSSTNGEYSSTNGEYSSTNGEYISTNGQYRSTNGEYISTNGEYSSTNGSRHTSTGEDSISLEGCQAPLSAGSAGSVGEPSLDLLNGCNGTALTPISDDESRELLAKLEEANRMLEADCKHLRSLSPHPPGSPARPDVTAVGRFLDSGHSRQGSVSSEVSTLSAASSSSQPDDSIPEDLWSAWRTVVDEWNTKSKKKQSYIRELVRRGVPHHFRGIVWPLLSGSNDSKDSVKYMEYMKLSSPCEKLIRRDITRTYPDHELFKIKNGKGQESLFNVMKAYSLHDVEVGYCQGSSFIVGLLLMQMPEEDAFAVLVKIMQVNRLRELYKPSMAELGVCMYQLESMIQEQLPELCTHFHAHDFHVSMFATPWFLTLYATSLPMPIVCRIFDIFLLEGLEIVFRIGFAMLQLSSSELQSLDMEGMMRVLQKDLPARFEGDPESLFTTAFQVNYSARKMKKLEKEYNTLKSKESQEQADLRRLKTENRLLRQRIESLENETSTLADRLIHDQVRHANASEEVFSLRRQMSFSRQQSQEQSLCKSGEDEADGSDAGGMRAIVVAKDAQIAQLQHSLTEAHQREINEKSTVQELRIRVQELENFTTSEPDSELQSLQEQLIASKMREAESNLLVRELEQKVSELERHWQKYLEDWNNPDANRKLNKTRLQEASEDLMSCRIRETNLASEITNLKQKLMDIETSNHIFERQVRRLESENAKLQEQLSELEKKEQELLASVSDMERQTSNLESNRREEEIMSRIKEAEHAQTVAELQQKIAELEIQNQELVTAEQLHSKSAQDGQNIERRIAELKEELVRLRSLRCSRLGSTGTISYDTDSDDDYELNVNKLQLTQSLPSPADVALRNLVDGVEEDAAETSADHDRTLVEESLALESYDVIQPKSDFLGGVNNDVIQPNGGGHETHSNDDSDDTINSKSDEDFLKTELKCDHINKTNLSLESCDSNTSNRGEHPVTSATEGDTNQAWSNDVSSNDHQTNGGGHVVTSQVTDGKANETSFNEEAAVVKSSANEVNSIRDNPETLNCSLSDSDETVNSKTTNSLCATSDKSENVSGTVSDSSPVNSPNMSLAKPELNIRTLESCGSDEVRQADNQTCSNNNISAESKGIVNSNLNEVENENKCVLNQEAENQSNSASDSMELSDNTDFKLSSENRPRDIYENHTASDDDDADDDGDDCAFDNDCDSPTAFNEEKADAFNLPQNGRLSNSSS